MALEDVSSSARPSWRRSEVWPAVACASTVVLLWLLLPVLERLDPTAVDGFPVVGDLTWWAGLALLGSQSSVLIWRRRHPEKVGVVIAAAVPLGAAIGLGSAIGLTSFAVFVSVLALTTSQAAGRVRPALMLIAASVWSGHALAGLMTDVQPGQAVLTGFAQSVVLVGAPMAVGALVVARRDSRTADRDRLGALEREHDALVQAAIAGERTAMARELHDIAAHHLTGIAILSAGIAAQIDTDPAGAKSAVADVRQQSTAVLRDLRSLVGLLREDRGTEVEGDTRVESLAGVNILVSEIVAAGQDVVVRTRDGEGRGPLGAGIGPLAQLATYRTVQEALANAGRHAPGARCEVEIDDRDPEALVVTVRNEAGNEAPDPGARGGFGLVGMRERAELTGSQLDVGPASDGGWQVRLRMPRAVPEATS